MDAHEHAALMRKRLNGLRSIGGGNYKARPVYLSDRKSDVPPARCFGDAYRERKVREGMAGCDNLGTLPGKGTDFSLVERWEERKARRAREAAGPSQKPAEIDDQDDGSGIDDLLECRAPSRRPRTSRPSRHHLTINEITRKQIARGERNEKRPPRAKPGAA